MKIKFDITGAPEEPTLILATREGYKLGQIAAKEISGEDYLNEASVFQFKVYKFIDGVEDPLWEDLTNFKLVWVKEWDMWFQMVLDVEESIETVKTCECTKLGEAELSQIMLYNIEINTENDILRDDYTDPTVFYNPNDPSCSLLNRMMEKCPHYSIRHVDSTLCNIQRTFTFDDESIYDSFLDVAEEIGCLFVFDSNSNGDGSISRTISVYDLESNCNNCGHRGEFTGVCPECGSTDINEGYGEDTTIFITADELSDDIQFTTDTDAVKNCFRLEAGDDLMTATVRNCNPNGSQYIYYFSDETKAEMPTELVKKIETYDELYDYYQNEYVVDSIPSSIITSYNNLVTKYREYDPDLALLPSQIVGYPELMNAYYEAIDFEIYLQSSLMPDTSLPETSASEEAAKLTASSLSPVAVANINSASESTATNAVVNMAKCIVDARYKVTCNNSSYSKSSSATSGTWTGVLTVTNNSDEDDEANTNTLTITINGDYETYLRQCIEKSLNKDNTDDVSVTALFNLSLSDFKNELKKYCLDSLNMFYDSCEACLDILIEQGVADNETWGTESSNSSPKAIYDEYREKLNAITDEAALRESEVQIIAGAYDFDGNVTTKGLENYIQEARNAIQEILDFENYLGETLWLQFCAYRREDTYSNSNYISDGLNNAELFERALEFIEVASTELYKSAELQHSIESDLVNLLVMDKFKALLDHFEVGNWLRIRIDGKVYKLRLISYMLEWDNIETISVDFSDVTKVKTGVSDLQSIVQQASRMATSYDAVQHQASQGSSANSVVAGWSLEGLNVTNTRIIQNAEGQDQTWDEHGILLRKYSDLTETYDDEQMKIVNSTIAITDDNWESVKTAIGRFYYTDPSTGNLMEAYGINAEVLLGQLILGEDLEIYNQGGSLVFDKDGLTISTGTNSSMSFTTRGLVVTNGTYTFTVDPNSSTLVKISKGSSDVLTVSNSGNLVLDGTITAGSGSVIGGWSVSNYKIYSDDGSLSSDNPTAVCMQVPGGSRYTVFAAGGSTHSDYSDAIFRVDRYGTLYTQDIQATGGTIGGWTISSSKIYNKGGESDGTAVMQMPSSSITYVFAAGGSSHSSYGDCPFRVTKAGKLYASNAEIDGTIYATTMTAENNYRLHMTADFVSTEATLNIISALNNSGSTNLSYQVGFPSKGYGITFNCPGNSSYVSISLDANMGITFGTSTTFFSDVEFDDSVTILGHFAADLTQQNTSSSAPNVFWYSGNNRFRVSTNTSSERYKNLEGELTSSDIEILYSIPVYWFKYKEDFLWSGDERYDKLMPGFIAEDWDEIFPIAVDHNEEDGSPERWNPQYVVPLMFEMIKNDHEEIESLKQQLAELQA